MREAVVTPPFRPDCMTPGELAAWQEKARQVRNGGHRPCVDCPEAFAAEMTAAGRCNGFLRVPPTPADGLAERRRRNREAVRRYQARRRVA